MLFFKRILLKCKHAYDFNTRCSSSLLHERELIVPTFCDLFINLPFNVRLKPLDVHQYHNGDKLIVQFTRNEPCQKFDTDSVTCFRHGNRVDVLFSDDENNFEDVTCHIKAPLKANLTIHTTTGNITISNFNGDKIKASSEKGTITVNKFHGEEISLETYNGDILLTGATQASRIEVKINEAGSITTDRLQALCLALVTKTGDIKVNSSYCNDSSFVTEEGNLNLKNVHKDCKIWTKKIGDIIMTGFDGKLNISQNDGSADIHLSRITDDSIIEMLGRGHLTLRISEDCQENTGLEVRSEESTFDTLLLRSKLKDTILLTPVKNNYKIVKLNCTNCSVEVKTASWADMLELNMKR